MSCSNKKAISFSSRCSAGCLLVIAALVCFIPLTAHAQIPSLKKALESTDASKPAAPENVEDVKKRIELWRQEARDQVARIEAQGATLALPEGITPAEAEDRRRDLEQIILITSSWLKNFSMLADARTAAETARSNETAWAGFKESPPYSILMVDDLLNERDAIKAKLSSNEASLANFERLLSTTLAETKTAEEAVSAGIVAVQNAAPAVVDAAKWRLEAARSQSRVLVARAGFLQANSEAFKERIAAAKAELLLVEKKIRIAAPTSQLSDEDLTKIEKITQERKAAIEKEITAVSQRLKSALATKTQAQSALDALKAKSAEAPDPENAEASAEDELAKFRLEVADGRIESLQSISENLESLVQLETIVWKTYQDRALLFKSQDIAERKKALESLDTISDRLRAWLNVVENEMTTIGADLSNIESRAASITAEDPRFALLNEQRASRSEMLSAYQRSSQAVTKHRKLIRRWIADFTPKDSDISLYQRVATFTSNAWTNIRKIWSFEVMSFEDKIEVDGQTISGKIPVTLGMLLRAILFFVIGYWIASRIANRIQRTIVTRGHIAEAQARTLRNWLMIAVGVFLVIGTLSFLKIPLTVFAFFGGALAIGIGFGTQTLIKNFISGLIVLAERKVRVGDILDVDGIVGTVVEVNTRSSVIRGADDVETMIPNSAFLENRVTNWTLSSDKVRRSLRVGVAYGTTPQTVMEILTDCASRHGLICKTPAPFAVFQDFGDNALLFDLYFWVEMGGGTNAMVVASDLRLMIEKRFTEAAIGVPYPQRDMHLTTDHPILVQMTAADTPPPP
ncbi:MAG: mechanosensitive ion channel [Akkermansiaceae bacterium]|nr:mechanosensitive ion channel [Akkermansiaceae bacterium]